MASTILGKRQRGALDSPDLASGRPTRRRRAQSPTAHHAKPGYQSSPSKGRRGVQRQQSIDIFEDQDEVSTNDGLNPAPLPKDSNVGGQTALSPSKINSHFKTSKTASDENTKPSQLKTPQTVRFRDAFSKQIPSTPRHRVSVVGKPLTPRTLRTPTSVHSMSTVYSSARQLFAQSANPGQLVGRENERQEVEAFLRKRIESSSGGCLYVSGPPGTGKSALIAEVCDQLRQEDVVRTVHVNCVSMKGTKDVHERLADALLEKSELDDEDLAELLKATFVPRRKPSGPAYVVALDEIDHLLTADVEILYSLFEWSLHRNSRLILIGIANALDLTDRFLPRLKSRNLKPQLLPFLPYSAPQIASVITTRLQSLMVAAETPIKNYVPFLHPAAIQLCAKKVASQTGDLRKAFDIVRRAVDLIESDTKQKHQRKIEEDALQFSPTKSALVDNLNFSSPLSDPKSTPSITLASSLALLTPETAPRASIAHVARVTSTAFGNGAVQRLQNLNLQQKAALCALVAMEKKRRSHNEETNVLATPSKLKIRAPTVKHLFDSYCVLCKRDKVLHPLNCTEFRDVVSSLETLGLVHEVNGKNGSFRAKAMTPSKRGRGALGSDEMQMASCVSEKELRGCIEGVGGEILKNLLSSDE